MYKESARIPARLSIKAKGKFVKRVKDPYWVSFKIKTSFVVIEHFSSMYISILLHINGPQQIVADWIEEHLVLRKWTELHLGEE